MSPSALLVGPPAPASPSIPPRRCAPPASAAAATLRTSPGASSVAQFSRLRTKCRFAAPGVRGDFSSTPIDVVADVKTEKIVVLGGSGFVGSAICRAAVAKGIEVVSLSRSGRPSYSDPWADEVTWLAGDVFYAVCRGRRYPFPPVTVEAKKKAIFGRYSPSHRVRAAEAGDSSPPPAASAAGG